MIPTLEAAIGKLAALPPEEQERFGGWILEELGSEERWANLFASSQDFFGELAAEARAELEAGEATELDPDRL